MCLQVEPYHWCDSFQDRAQTILTQHLGQCGMCPTDIALAQWAEYISVHVDHPLSFKLFSILLEKLVKPIKQGFLSDENVSHISIIAPQNILLTIFVSAKGMINSESFMLILFLIDKNILGFCKETAAVLLECYTKDT